MDDSEDLLQVITAFSQCYEFLGATSDQGIIFIHHYTQQHQSSVQNSEDSHLFVPFNPLNSSLAFD